MTSLLISDFRGAQLQHCTGASDVIFICEDFAECSWLKNGIAPQLAQFSVSNASTIIMLGFNDCALSCEFSSFNINTIATDYAKAINGLIEDYSSHTFYVCTIPPVDSDYPYAGGLIDCDTLNSKIKSFNNKIKANCKATLIDCHKYLDTVGFETRDGVRYLPDTCEGLLAYIVGSTKYFASVGSHSFSARSKAPVVDDDIDSDIYWLSNTSAYGGLNPFGGLGQANARCEGDTLPNCTAYAWGRFYEILGSEPKLSTGKVEQWYTYTSDGYQRGLEPKLGAIMCWKGNNSASTDGKGGNGFVAVVEKINADGSIKTSESSFGNPRYWWTTNRTKGSDGNWGQGSTYTFQGFIYCPAVASSGSSATGGTGTTISYVDKSQVTSSNKYLGPGYFYEDYSNVGSVSQEMKNNAIYIWQYFKQRGWTLNAVAAMLGNMQTESTINPGKWQNTPWGGRGGYGLTQWTPYKKYTDWCAKNGYDIGDIDAALKRIEAEYNIFGKAWVEGLSIWQKKAIAGYMTFPEFVSSTQDPAWLAVVFMCSYEKPASMNDPVMQERRGRNAKYWYEYLASSASTTVEIKPQLSVSGFKIDSITSTSVEASFISKQADGGKYSITEASGKSIVKNRSLKCTKTDNMQLMTLKYSSLKPNQQYKLTVSITNEDNDEETLKESLTFTTAQDYPETISKVELTATDSKLPYNNFKLSASPKNPDFGYWESNGSGYTIQLIVNGRVKEEKEASSLPKNINISNYFGYKSKIADIIQIGIHTWVNYDGDRLYDSEFATVSNPICMLANDFVAYLTNK